MVAFHWMVALDYGGCDSETRGSSHFPFSAISHRFDCNSSFSICCWLWMVVELSSRAGDDDPLGRWHCNLWFGS